MEVLVGGEGGVDLPLHEAVHAHEGAESLGDHGDVSVGEYGAVLGHCVGDGAAGG